MRQFYPGVHFPVDNKTALISPLVKWNHSVSWFTPKLSPKDCHGESVLINISEQKWSYLQGHEVDGRILMPAMSYLVRLISVEEQG